MCKVIVFDIGNVIVPIDYRPVFSAFALRSELSEIEVRENFGVASWYNTYKLGHSTSKQFYEDVKAGLRLSMSFDEFRSAWLGAVIPSPIIPDWIIENLASSYKLLVLSNSNPIHYGEIRRRVSFLDLFSGFILSHEVGYIKPQREIFERMFPLAECSPDKCLVVDDLQRNVNAATSFGIKAHRFEGVDGLIRVFDNYAIRYQC